MERKSSQVGTFLDRLKEQLGIEKDIDLANILGKAHNTISNWRSRNSRLPLDQIVPLCEEQGLKVDWNYVIGGGQGSGNVRLVDDVVSLPLYVAPASAGLPTPVSSQKAEESVLVVADMVPHPKASYAVRVAGDSMKGAGIQWGDIVIVDRKKEVVIGSVVVAVVEGATTLKRLQKVGDRWFLYAANDDYKPIEITDLQTTLQGVVIGLIRDLKNLN